MLLRLLGERAPEKRLERETGAQRRTQIDLVIAEQAGPQSTVGREAHTVAAAAIRVRHRRDHADRTRRAGKPMIRRRSVAARGTGDGLERAELPLDAAQHL